MSDIATILEQNLKHTLFSWSKQGGLNPIVAEKAKGVYIYDKAGKKYLDFSSQLMNVNIGHGNEKVNQAVTEQMSRLAYVFPGMATEARGRLGAKLAELAPGDLNRTFFTLGGAEAVENAIKLARHYTGRFKIFARYRSYHGATHGALQAGGDPRKLEVDAGAIAGVVHFEGPYQYRCPWNTTSEEDSCKMALSSLERQILFEGPNNVAAILMEGESGSSGVLKHPKGYWQGLRKIADKYGILLIDDEVMSGFGRTGKMFAINHHDVVPDIMVIAKGLTSGYLPLGGIIVKEEIAQHYSDKAMPLGLTYSAHAAACACAIANIDVIEGDKLVDNAAQMGHYIEEKVAQLAKQHPSIGEFRNNGLLGCIELVKNRTTREPVTEWNASGAALEATNKMAAKVRELGMFTFVRWNWIFIAPPLIVTKAEVDEGIEILSQVISIADEYTL